MNLWEQQSPVEVKNLSSLQDSTAKRTNSELLRTEDAYFCERHGKKVNTVTKRWFRKPPPIPIIQLKRFD